MSPSDAALGSILRLLFYDLDILVDVCVTDCPIDLKNNYSIYCSSLVSRMIVRDCQSKICLLEVIVIVSFFFFTYSMVSSH